MSRPEYVTCIKHNHIDFEGETWCGNRIIGFTFESLDHAANNYYSANRLVACKNCTDAAIENLVYGQSQEAP